MKDIEDFKKEKVYIVLVGNKCDSLDRVITEEEGINLAKEYKIDFLETSAKNDKYILNYIIKKINKIIKKFVNLYFIFYNHQIHLKLINNFNYF